MFAMPTMAAPVGSYSATEGGPVINVGDASGNIGDTVRVPISIAGNPGIVTARLFASYDESMLRLVNVEDPISKPLGAPKHKNTLTAPYILFWENGAGGANIYSDGEIAALLFEVLGEGSSDVVLSYNDAGMDIHGLSTGGNGPDVYPVYFGVANGSVTGVACVVEPEVELISATPTAYVEKLNGNQNKLFITVTELYSDGSKEEISAVVMISNNSAGTYSVGTYRVYVDTKGNTQIRACEIV
jgi:hypothetical protein